MKPLRDLLDKQAEHFEEGGKLEKLYPFYEAGDTFLYTPGEVTQADAHVRDGMDLKRMMITVVLSLQPCILFALYNTGLQASLAYQNIGAIGTGDWHIWIAQALGLSFLPSDIISCFAIGAIYFVPVQLVTIAAGGLCEAIFAVIRKHEINEGFLVTSTLFPLTMPPLIPLWQVAIGIIFGVVIGKEIFGGVGMNFLNPALTGRAFLYFAYPAQISGDAVWIAVDGYSQATPLAAYADTHIQLDYTWWESFIGLIPGSMGETSTLCCLLGAGILILTRVGSWQIMAGVTIGMIVSALFFNWIGSTTNPLLNVSPAWHFVIGGFAFGTVFMATDPVSATMTRQGKWVYGILIGVMTVLIRVTNPAYPEGIMLAILFANVFAPIIDRVFINRNIQRRLARAE
ncbi:MAG: NADH:ubiquinone reductase (Na(+)-transporting) subunit B [Gemmatimonadetes bacterium]|nr:NADH:ubiquinone reductase (Na(+)-transporting) subunit B [Gemmatimonadota bacterium]MYB56682.1 NADH:ubiquinone reductase (Na(+)-transporting) subunit B [Gemmatimonadota bacterium]